MITVDSTGAVRLDGELTNLKLGKKAGVTVIYQEIELPHVAYDTDMFSWYDGTPGTEQLASDLRDLGLIKE